MIAMDVLRTEPFEYQGVNYTIRLNKYKSNGDYEFSVTKEKSGKSKPYHSIPEETAMAFFDNAIPKDVKGDIEAGKI